MSADPDDDRRVRIYEVGPRDGLQNESIPIPTETKLRFIELLVDAGLREIEATSFVSPTAIPQLADADDLFARLPRGRGVRFPVLVPNERGLARAEAAGVDAAHDRHVVLERAPRLVLQAVDQFCRGRGPERAGGDVGHGGRRRQGLRR